MVGKEAGNPATVGQHVFRAGFAEFLAEPVIAVEDLADNGFGARRVDVAFFHGETGWEPPAGIHILLNSGKINRKIIFPS